MVDRRTMTRRADPDTAVLAAVKDVLCDVLDPCSCFTEQPMNVIDLGLIEDVTVNDGEVYVRMVLTSGDCPFFANMSREIETKVSELPAVDSVRVTQETGIVWTPERMDQDQRDARRKRMHDRMRELGVTPAMSPN